jgi:hypothetical protein
MKRFGVLLASVAVGATLSGPAGAMGGLGGGP